MTAAAASLPSRLTTFAEGLVRLCALIAEKHRLAADARALDQLPSDRLEDMGVPKRSTANHRSSADSGSIPRTDLV